MRRIIFIVLTFVIGLTTITYAQSKVYQKEQEKYEKKAKALAKKMSKEFKKGKWETTGATDLETVLTSYYLQTEPSCGGSKKGVDHMMNDAKKIDIAEKKLLLTAQSIYSQEMCTMLAQTIRENGSIDNEEDIAAYTSSVTAKSQKEFNGDLERSFIIYRTNPDGKTLTVRAFYIIDQENGLTRIRKLAEKIRINEEIQHSSTK